MIFSKRIKISYSAQQFLWFFATFHSVRSKFSRFIFGESEKLGGKAASGFVASKWETVDPEEVKKGVVTTSKWETEEKDELVKARKALMGSVASKWDDREDDIDGVPMGRDSDSGEVEELDPRKDEERRAILREVEVRVMQYQDELESGRKSVKSGWTVAEQVQIWSNLTSLTEVYSIYV